MDERERAFWLQYSRLPVAYAKTDFPDIPGDSRCILKNNLYRGAARLQLIAGALA